MPDVAIKDINNKDAGKMQLDDALFAIKGKDALLHSAVRNYLANRRQGTHSTKGRSDVRGGGAKPYKQKGTGRARAGTNNSPLWRGGGTVFGPQPRDYSYSMPRKALRQAFYAALSAKLADGEVVVVNGLSVDAPKTKQMVQVLDTFGISGGSVLVVLKEMDANVALSLRNIPAAHIILAQDLNAYDVLSHRNLLITKEAMESLEDGSGQ
ncbi:MAG: 50S ribosomal protein L4 [Thermodesulfovibrionales bacterium]|nr:50S ribosomal protein L4 [Thermodesulfovibrionales bacterium]